MKTDIQIQQDVMDELQWQPFLNASEIGVSVKNGVVTLSGTVNSYAKKVAAERAAKNVKGVRAVAEDLVVRQGPDSTKSDSDLAAAILTSLRWHSDIREENLKIKVEDGFVTLEGQVQWPFEKQLVSEAIENITGINGIINNIIVVPGVQLANVEQEIRRALNRHADIDAENIHITIEGDKVILTGKVHSAFAKNSAAKAVWLAPGVREVENKLDIFSKVYAL